MRLKRDLWDGLLRQVYGDDVGSDALFLQHTYLTILVKAIAARVLDLAVDDPAAMLSGRLLADEGIVGAVEADFFDYIDSVEPASLDGVFFDPFLPAEMGSDEHLWRQVTMSIVNALKPGGAFIPFFTTRPELKWPFCEYFDRAIVLAQPRQRRALSRRLAEHGVASFMFVMRPGAGHRANFPDYREAGRWEAGRFVISRWVLAARAAP